MEYQDEREERVIDLLSRVDDPESAASRALCSRLRDQSSKASWTLILLADDMRAAGAVLLDHILSRHPDPADPRAIQLEEWEYLRDWMRPRANPNDRAPAAITHEELLLVRGAFAISPPELATRDGQRDHALSAMLDTHVGGLLYEPAHIQTVDQYDAAMRLWVLPYVRTMRSLFGAASRVAA